MQLNGSNTNIDMFEVFPWTKEFETGHPQIDEQHQVLVSLLNKLAVTLVFQDEVELNAVFNELSDYVNMHFADEEKIWVKYFQGDPWLASHEKTHASFLPFVKEIRKKSQGESLPDVVEKIVHYLLQWLISHIIDTDKRMVIAVRALESGSTIDEAKIIADKEMSGSELILINAILKMYEGLSSRTIALMREMNARKEAEEKLNKANKKLESLIITDSLTGLFNRRHLDNIFQTRIRKAIRDKTAISYFLIDIDFFKSINDHYGHLAGDQALEQLGACLIKICRRPDDMAFRIGGEEFGILTTNKSENDAAYFAEMIRAAIEALKIPNEQSETNKYMTASIGVVYKTPSREDTQDKFFNIADIRLYRAKSSGRNQVVITD